MSNESSDNPLKTLRERVKALGARDGAGLLALLDEVEELHTRKTRELLEQRHALLESMVDGAVTIDERGLILSFNHVAEQMFGRKAAEVVGQNVRLLMPAPYRERHDGYIQAYLETGVKRIIGIGRQVAGVRADGTEFPLELAVTELWLGGERCFLGIVRDLTERARLHDELVLLQKLEAVGRLASGIAHDFNNLLMGIMGCTTMATRKLEEGSPAKPYIDEIRGGAQRGVALTRQLLDFSRRRPTHLQRCAVNDVVRTTQVMLRQLIGERVALRVKLAESEPQVGVDFGRVEQILMNLATNARDAIPDGGDLTITTLVEGDEVVLEVADTGVGMDATTRERAFEPFFTTKPPNEGTGLGLSTVFGIVQRAHGRIELTSEPERGTKVTIHFPRATARGHGVHVESARSARRGTVLVVDEEEVVRLTVRDYLEEAGFGVLEASHLKEALQVFAENASSIRLVLADLRLPGGGGAELARVARASQPDIRILYLCTYSLPNHVPDPPAPCVRKPIGQHTLLEAVVRALEGGTG